MLSIAVDTLYATWRKRGTRRQLTGGVVVCVVCALLLLVAIIWYNTRFNVQPGAISRAETEAALAYVALLGWFLPLSTSIAFCLFASLRVLTTSVEIPKQGRTTKGNPTTILRPPRHQHGIPAPFVYDEQTPWCRLEYCNGRLQGQRLDLKQAIVTLGREEDNDVWIDDEQASRYHAELAYENGDVYLTDCDSMNGVLLNGLRIQGTALIESGAIFEVGTHRFRFVLVEYAARSSDLFDPFANRVLHLSHDSLTVKETNKTPSYRTTDDVLPASTPEISASLSGLSRLPGFLRMPSMPGIASVEKDENTFSDAYLSDTPRTLGITKLLSSPHHTLEDVSEQQSTAPIDNVLLPARTMGPRGMLIFHSGDEANKTRILDHLCLTIGRGEDCDIIVQDDTISRQHAQFVRQADGDYVQDLASQNGTYVNEEVLLKPHLLRTGDMIRLGSVYLQYASLHDARETPLPLSDQSRADYL